jgi:nucleoside 2-deoxyribosyltransferase
MSKVPKLYLAAPLFTPPQILLLEQIETLASSLGYSYFSPRQGSASKTIGASFKAGLKPSQEVLAQVFKDNVENIDDADLLIAVIDGRDAGTLWEMGYAYKSNVPILSFTDQGFGMNIMLSQCVIGHVKGIQQLDDALCLFKGAITSSAQLSAESIANIMAKYLIPVQLTEGPAEGKA